MLLYILKSATILAVLLLFYKLFLEKESIHTFKRFYLLVAAILSFTIPFITFVEYVEIPAVTQIVEQPSVAFSATTPTPQEIDLTDYLPHFLWSTYILGFLFFSYKFVKNLSDIVLKIRNNPKFRIKQITNVLLIQNVTPHTFFNYIFLNKNKFESDEIPKEACYSIF